MYDFEKQKKKARNHVDISHVDIIDIKSDGYILSCFRIHETSV